MSNTGHRYFSQKCIFQMILLKIFIYKKVKHVFSSCQVSLSSWDGMALAGL